MPPRMCKRWMLRELKAMRELVTSLGLEEPPGMVGLGIRLENGSTQLGRFFFLFSACSFLHLIHMQIAVDEQRLMPPPSIPTSAPSSTASSVSAVPSISPHSRFGDLSLRSPAITSLVSSTPSIPQQPPPDNSLLTRDGTEKS
jgi:hypothetical protein